jgi:hypothetical protein
MTRGLSIHANIDLSCKAGCVAAGLEVEGDRPPIVGGLVN